MINGITFYVVPKGGLGPNVEFITYHPIKKLPFGFETVFSMGTLPYVDEGSEDKLILETIRFLDL